MRKGRSSKRGIPRVYWLLPLAVVGLLVALSWLFDAWLESAGGRSMVERRLGGSLGMPVSLAGEFRVMLIPAPGVAGTDLWIGGPGQERVLMRSRVFEVVLLLKPLLRRQIVIESLRLEDGSVYPANYEPAAAGAPPAPERPPAALPELERLSLRRFQLFLPGQEGARLTIDEFELRDFADARAAPYTLEIAPLEPIRGHINWSSATSTMDLIARWNPAGWGEIEMAADFSATERKGHVKAIWRSERLPQNPALNARFHLHEEGVAVPAVVLSANGQSLAGQGCLLAGEKPAVHLELESGRLDLQAWLDVFGSTAAGTDPDPWTPPMPLRVRVHADELHAAEAVARDALLAVGDQPDCSTLSGADES